VRAAESSSDWNKDACLVVTPDVNDNTRDHCDPGNAASGLTSRWRGVRQLIEDGALPSVIPTRIWGGRGRGEHCAACASHITEAECAFEIPVGTELVTLDRGCLNLWMASISRSP
jgi:hypothetical protein